MGITEAISYLINNPGDILQDACGTYLKYQPNEGKLYYRCSGSVEWTEYDSRHLISDIKSNIQYKYIKKKEDIKMFNINDKVITQNMDGQYNNVLGTIIKIHPNIDVEMVYTVKYDIPFGNCTKGMFKESDLKLI